MVEQYPLKILVIGSNPILLIRLLPDWFFNRLTNSIWNTFVYVEKTLVMPKKLLELIIKFVKISLRALIVNFVEKKFL